MLRRYRKYTLFYKPVIYVYTISICNNAAKLTTILISEGDSKTPGLLQIPRLVFRKLIFKLSYVASSEKNFFNFLQMNKMTGIFQKLYLGFSSLSNISRRHSKVGFRKF